MKPVKCIEKARYKHAERCWVLIHVYRLCRYSAVIACWWRMEGFPLHSKTGKNSWSKPLGCCLATAVLQALLREPMMPKATTFPEQCKAQGYHLQSACAVNHSRERNYLECGSLCSPMCTHVAGDGKIAAGPQRQSGSLSGLQRSQCPQGTHQVQPGSRRLPTAGTVAQQRNHKQDKVSHQKCLFLTSGLLDKPTFYQPMTSDKASLKNTDVKMRSWVVISGSSSGLYIYYNYTQP